MAHELRKLMAVADKSSNGGPLGGHIEADETYVGGRTGREHAGRSATKRTPVFAIIERGGRIRAWPVKSVAGGTLTGIIEFHVKEGSRISTDEFGGYARLRHMGFEHRTVKHSSEQYVDGDTHVNTAEGYFSRFKNSVRGTHVHISKRHMWKYVAEFNYRYNMRKQPAAIFDQMILAVSLPPPGDDLKRSWWECLRRRK